MFTAIENGTERVISKNFNQVPGPQFLVLKKARAQIVSITRVTASPVSQGQASITFSVSITNPGEASISGLSTALRFITPGNTNVTSQYTVTSNGCPSTLAGGASSTFNIVVTASSTATAGTINVGATTSGTGVPGSAIGETANNLASMTVLTKSDLRVTNIVTQANAVSQGHPGLLVDMFVANLGQALANIGSDALKLSQGGVTKTFEYGIEKLSGPTTLAGGATATFKYEVNVGSQATPGLVTIDGSSSGTNSLSGAATTSNSAAGNTDSWTVFQRAALRLDSVQTSATPISQGVQGKLVQFTVTNPGAVQADIEAARLSYRHTGSGRTWTNPANTGPAARSGPSVAYDQARTATILFGGTTGSLSQETWTYTGTWKLESPATKPPARRNAAVAFDLQRSRVVLFGGSGSGGALNDTWEWNGSNWTDRSTASRPPAQDTTSEAVYDAGRQRVLLLARATGNAKMETWEWDGTNWNQSIPNTAPPVRTSHAMAYDVVRGRVVLFGGRTLTNTLLGDTWEWDGGGWTNVTPATSPPTRHKHRMVYDPNRGRVILHGGSRDGAGLLNDSWEWHGSQWAALTTSTSPPVRSEAGMVYDLSKRNLLLFGGTGDTATPRRGDTWQLADGENVTLEYDIRPSSGNLTAIAAGASTTFDFTVGIDPEATPGVALIGGSITGRDSFSTLVTGDPFFKTNTQWTVLTKAKFRIDSLDTANASVSQGQTGIPMRMAITNLGEVAGDILSGGPRFKALPGLADVTGDYTQTAVGGNLTRIPALSAVNLDFTMATNAESTLGGIRIDGAITGSDINAGLTTSDSSSEITDTWTMKRRARLTLDTIASPLATVSQGQGGLSVQMTVTNTGEIAADIVDTSLRFRLTGLVDWSPRSPSTQPSARTSAALAYDTPRGRAVLFGGTDEFGISAETWEWNNLNWSRRLPATSPAARNGPGMAFDSARGRILLFGGQGAAGALGDSWSWDGTNWSQRSPATSPSARTGHAVAFDIARGQAVLFGGRSGSADLADTWVWDGTDWLARSPATSPAARRDHALAYDYARGQTVLFGGRSSSGELADTWEWDGSNWAQRSAATAPPARRGHAMTHDNVRRRVELFGGRNSSGLFSDTWEWSGTSWDQKTTSTAPSARSGHAMAYDPGRGKSVLFGGETTGAVLSRESWDLALGGLVTTQFGQTTFGNNPTRILGGATATFTFTVSVGATATGGPLTIDGAVSGTDIVSGLATSDGLATNPDSWIVQSPATLRIDTVALAPSITQGQQNVPIRMAVTNTGTAKVTLDNAALKFKKGTTDVAGDYEVSSLATNANEISGGATAVLTFTVKVAPAATLGAVTIDGEVAGADANFGRPTEDLAATTPGTWQVQTVPALTIQSVTPVDSKVQPAQPGRSVTMRVSNAGTATATLATTALSFTAGSITRTSEYVMTPLSSNITQVAGEATVALTFTVDVKTDATPGAVTLRGAVTGTDFNSGDAVGASGAVTPGSWTVGTKASLRIDSVTAAAAKVSQGQAATAVTMQIGNDGTGTGVLTGRALTFSLSGADRAGDYTVTPAAGNITEVAGNATATLSFSVAVTPTAATGTIVIGGTLAGKDFFSETATTAGPPAATGSWLVQTPAVLAVRTVTASRSTVNQLQTVPAGVTVTVANTGEATARSVSIALATGGSTGAYTVAQAGGLQTIAGGTTKTFTLDVTVNEAAGLGLVTIDALAAGEDDNTGTAKLDGAADSPGSWTIQTPSRFAILSVTSSRSTVFRGLGEIPVTMKVANTGRSSANVSSASLRFKNAADRTSDYTSIADSTPASIAGETNAEFTFKVAVGAEADLGLINLHGTIAGADSNTGTAISSSVVGAPGSWTVLKPPGLSVNSVTATTALVAQGQSTLAFSMEVENTGQAGATLSSAGLRFAAAGDRTGDYTVVPGTNPTAIAAGLTKTFTFTVAVKSTAASGVVTVHGTLAGTDDSTGAAVSDTTTDRPHRWTVLTAGNLTLASVSAAATRVTRGQSSVPVLLSIVNSGQSTATLAATPLKFTKLPGTDVTAQYTARPAAGNVATVAGNTTATLTFAVDITSTATPGTIALDGAVAGTDRLSGLPLTAVAAALTDTWQLLTEAALSLTAVTPSTGVVQQEQAGVPVSVTIANTGEADAKLTGAALTFAVQGGAGVTTQYVVTPDAGNLGTLAGLGSKTLAFTVDISRTATPGTIVLDATAAGEDLVSAKTVSASGASAKGSWRVLTRPDLHVRTVTATPTVVKPGDTGIPFTVRIENTGEAVAPPATVALRMYGAQVTWDPLDAGSPPPARFTHAATYDAGRARTVIFGGRSAQARPLGDTWEFDGSRWTQAAPPTGPSARSGAALAYDSLRRRSVLFGGFDGRAVLAETWEWDGTSWTRRAPAVSPPARQLHGMVEDTVRGKLVLFGGADRALTPVAGDAWEYDGSAWTPLARAPAPAARHSHGMAFDSRRGRTVLFGGSSFLDSLADTWEWDGSAWAAGSTVSAPAARFSPAMAYDADRRVTVLAGGVPRNNTAIALPDTHEWDGSRWRVRFEPRTLAAEAGVTPGGRSGHSLVFDSKRRSILLFGGLLARYTGLGEFTIGQARTANDTFSKTASADSWALGFPDRTSDYVVTKTSVNPAPVGGLTTRDHTFTVDVQPFAQGGPVTLDALIPGTAVDRADQPDAWTVFQRAKLALREVTPSATEISPEQRQIRVAVSVANLGGSTATVDLTKTGLTFGTGPQSQSGYTVTTSGPASIAGRTTATYVFAVDAGTTVGLGPTAVDARIAAADQSSGEDASDSAADRPGSWRVLAPTILRVRAISAPPPQVVRGMTGVAFTMSVANIGQTTALIDRSRTGLTFNGTSTGFVVTTSGPDSLAGGTTATYALEVAVTATAPLGDTAVDGVAIGTDRLSGQSIVDRGADAPTAFRVLSPAALAIRRITASRALVNRGESGLDVAMTVENVGQSIARIDLGATGLKFNTSARGYRVTTSGPATLAGEQTAVFAFTVDTLPETPLGPTVIDGVVSGTDSLSGAAAGRQGADTAAAWRVLGPPAIVLRSITSPFAVVRAGETNRPVTLLAENTSGADLTLTSVALKLIASQPGWAALSPVSAPPARSSHALALDSRRNQLVLFGGFDGRAQLGDTWQWNGSNWALTAAGAAPAARAGHTLAFDAARGRTLLFGGDDGVDKLADSWEFDGSAWSRPTVAHSPAKRSGHAMAYDPLRERIVLFGGFDGSTKFADTWVWDGRDWSAIPTPAGGRVPAARSAHAMAHDPASGRILLFGGADSLGQRLADSWTFDGTWTDTLASGPPARGNPALALDSNRGRLVLFGGTSATETALADTWDWDGTSWTRALTAVAPTARFGHAMAAEPVSGRPFLFGGALGSGTRLADSWALAAADRAGDFTVRAAASNPGSVTAGGTAQLGFEVDVSATAATGEVRIDGAIAARDAVSGTTVTAASGRAGHLWSVFPTPALLAIRSLAVDREQVSRGGLGLPVTLSLANFGGTTGSVALGRTGLLFNGSAAGFGVTTSGPATVPGNTTATYTFAVDIRSSAPLGPTVLTAFASGADTVSGAPVTAAAGGLTASWTVFDELPAKLLVRSVRFPGGVTIGQQRVGLTVTVENIGSRMARVDSAGIALAFNGGLKGFTVTPAGGPATLAANQRGSYEFFVNLALDAPLGRTAIVAAIPATDELTNEAAGTPGTEAPGLTSVLRPAALRIRTIAPTRTFSRGQQGIVAVMSVENTGQTTARVDLALTGLRVDKRVLATFGVNGPVLVQPGTKVDYLCEVDVRSDAAFGVTVVDGVITGADFNTGGLFQDNESDVKATFQIGEPALLFLNGVAATRALWRRDDKKVQLIVRVSNGGDSAGKINVGGALGGPFAKEFLAVAKEGLVPPHGTLDYPVTLTFNPATIPIGFKSGIVLPLAYRDAGGSDRSGTFVPVVDTFEMQTSRAQLDVVEFRPSVFTVVLGQRQVLLTMRVKNSGETVGKLDFGKTALTFGGTDGGNSQTVAGVLGIEGGRTIGLKCFVDVGSRAPLGTVTMGAVLDGFDGISNEPAGGRPVRLPGSWTVKKPALLVVRELTLPRDRIRQGETGFTVTMALDNIGESDARMDLPNTTLTFNGNATGYASSVTGPAEVLGGGSGRYTFRVDAGQAELGPVAVRAVAVGIDSASGQVVRTTGGTASWTVDPPIGGELPPTANIVPGGPNAAKQTRLGGPREITLSGLGSSSGDKTPITYQWILVSRPEGGDPFSSTLPVIGYFLQPPGDYTFLLTVRDLQRRADTSNDVYSVTNVPPIVGLGRAQLRIVLERPEPEYVGRIQMRSDLLLDASRSSDFNSGNLSYRWTIVRAPVPNDANPNATPLVTFSSRDVAKPAVTFSGDFIAGTLPRELAAAGNYRFKVTVSDGFSDASAEVDAEAVDPLLQPPMADAGGARRVRTVFEDSVPAPTFADPLLPGPNNLRGYVRLDGRGSRGIAGIPLAAIWRYIGDKTALGTFDDSATLTPTFVPKKPGVYPFELFVSQKLGSALRESPPDRVEITVEAGNHQPKAAITAEGPNRLGEPIASSRVNPEPQFSTGERNIRLDGSGTTDEDAEDGPNLKYSWEVRSVQKDFKVFAPEEAVTFFEGKPGTYVAALTVADPAGARDLAQIRFHVVNPATAKGGPLVDLAFSSHRKSVRAELVEAPSTPAPRQARGERIDHGNYPQSPLDPLTPTLRQAQERGPSAKPDPFFAASPEEETVPDLTLVSSATTTAQRGEHLPAGVSVEPINSLRVTAPSTVTLSAFMTAPSTPGQRFDYVWNQVEGPPVLLSSTDVLDVSTTTLATRFTVTTCGVHVFELACDRLDADGQPAGFSASRRIRVVADTADCVVPGVSVKATLGSSAVTIPLTGTDAERTIGLDGSRVTAPAAQAAGLAYRWEQIDGPRGTLTGEFETVARFVAPALPRSTRAREYVFQFTATSASMGLASEPAFLSVRQTTPAAAVPAAETAAFARGGGGGGGCALRIGASGGAGRSAGWLLAWAVVLLAVRRRRRGGTRA